MRMVHGAAQNIQRNPYAKSLSPCGVCVCVCECVCARVRTRMCVSERERKRFCVLECLLQHLQHAPI